MFIFKRFLNRWPEIIYRITVLNGGKTIETFCFDFGKFQSIQKIAVHQYVPLLSCFISNLRCTTAISKFIEHFSRTYFLHTYLSHHVEPLNDLQSILYCFIIDF